MSQNIILRKQKHSQFGCNIHILYLKGYLYGMSLLSLIIHKCIVQKEALTLKQTSIRHPMCKLCKTAENLRIIVTRMSKVSVIFKRNKISEMTENMKYTISVPAHRSLADK